MNNYRIGIDVGGTKIAAALFEETHLVEKQIIDSNPDETFDSFLLRISSLVLALLKNNGLDITTLNSIGIGVPGIVDSQEGVLSSVPNLPFLKNAPICKALQDKLSLSCTVRVDNDCRCAGQAEALFGAGKGISPLLYCTISTGLASALIVNGIPYRGSHGTAGESGHMLYQSPSQGIPCVCGGFGCYNAYWSGKGFANHLDQTLPPESPLHQRKPLSLKMLSTLASEGDPDCCAYLTELGTHLAEWIFNQCMILDPTCVVLGGGLIHCGPLLLEPLEKHFYSLFNFTSPPTLKTANLDIPGLLGAAWLQ